MSFDTSFSYRLTNRFLGPGQSLDVRSDGSCRLKMAPTGDYSGQHWRLVARSGGRYALQTSYLGECFSLDVINDGTNTTPWLAVTGNYSGQYWTLTPWGDGTYRLTNDFTGPQRSLDTYSDTHDPFLDTGDHSGQHWTLTALDRIPGTAPVPELEPGGDVYKTEGPTDFSFYARPSGVVKAAMVFVDFPDAPAGSTSAAATADHLLGNGQAQRLYREQSYGQLSLEVTVRSDLGWRRVPKPSTSYHLSQFESHRSYITDAAALFQPTEIAFSDYQLVFVVAPRAASFPLSPAFNARPGQGAGSPSGEIRLAVTLGSDSYTNRYINLVHEVGHLFGLPDLYSYTGSGAADSKAGCWSIMSDIFHAVSFLGWHRHKNGWLPASRATYIADSTPAWYATLSPLSGSCGLSLLVLPVDDPHHPSKVLAVELAQPVLGSNGRSWGEGVLVYTVDATIATGSSPVVVIPKRASSSPDYGYLYEAPFGVGEVAHTVQGSVSLTMTVLQKFGSSYNVKVDYRR
jgi:M6 family metalloprotease-like protein